MNKTSKMIRQTMVALAFAPLMALAEPVGDFMSALNGAESQEIPLVVVWGNTSCGYCNVLTNALADARVVSWFEDHQAMLVVKHEEHGSTDADYLAAKNWLKAINPDMSGFPYVGLYWKTGNVEVIKTAFTGRKGTMPVTTPADDLAGQFVGTLDAYFGTDSEVLPDGYNYTEEDENGYTWTFSVINGEAVIGVTDEYGNEQWQKAISPDPLGALAVPDTLGGCPVTQLGYCALEGCDGMTSVILPDVLCKIGDYAFVCCDGISIVSIPLGVTSIGDDAFSDCTGLSVINIPNTVTNIGNGAFCRCDSLTKIVIPPSVEEIGDCAFDSCQGLETVIISNGVKAIGDFAFGESPKLKTLTIPSSVERMGHFSTAVYENGELNFESVTFEGDAPDGFLISPEDDDYEYLMEYWCYPLVMYVHEGAMGWPAAGEWYGSEIVVLPDSDILPDGYNYTEEDENGYTWTFSVINGEAVIGVTDEYGNPQWQKAVSPEPSGALTVPDTLGGCSVTELGQCALYDCDGITSVSLPEILCEIGDRSFESCDLLSMVDIPSSVESIGCFAFAQCHQITAMIIPEGVRTIRYAAFWNMCGLTSVSIPSTVEEIDEEVFDASWELLGLSVDAHNACYSSENGVLYSKNKMHLIFWPHRLPVQIPDTVRSIGYRSVYCNFALMGSALEIPSSVTNIECAAFQGCQLCHVTLNEGLVSLGAQAFGANKLCSVVMPSTVRHVDYGVFNDGNPLLSVFFRGNAPDDLDERFFEDAPTNLIAFVRPGSTGWSSAGSSELPEMWPTSGNYQRAIRTWTTYPDVSFLVTFDLGEHGTRTGGGELEQLVVEGGAAEAPEVETDEGYTFCGWDSSFDCISGSTTIKAVYVYVETGTPMVANVTAGVEPPWSRKVTVEYDGLGGSDASDKIVRMYYLADGAWQRIPSSLISGDLSVATGRHAVEIDTDGCGFEPGEVMLKFRVIEKSEDGINVENDDGWTEEDTTIWRSRKIGDDEETSLCATVEGMGEFVFSWKASSESVSWDWLECFVDGESAGKIGGETDWEEFVVELPDDGVHEIAWTYRKDSSVSSGQDCGWVDLSLAGTTEVIGETPVTVVIPEPTMELDAEMTEDGTVELVPGFGTATIYYTLDGSVPTVGSAIYMGPMAWSDFKKMRAVALTDDGDWSEVLIGSEYVRISFDPVLGTMEETASILRKIGEPIGELPEVERGDYGFNGWTPYYDESEGWVDEDTEVESWWTTLYATWDIEAEEVLDPTGDLGLIEFNDEYDYWIGRERNPWREYVQISGEIEPQTTSTVFAVEFDGVGVLNFERLYTWYDGVSYLLDGEPCTVANKQLKVLSGGEHRFEIAFANDNTDDCWLYFHLYIGAMTWAPCENASQAVTFDANGGLVWPKSKTFTVGNAYGSLPTPTRSGFSFDGWHTSARGGMRMTASDYVDFTVDTLYAHWRGSVADYMGGEVSNATVGNDDIYSDGDGVVFPIPNWDWDESYAQPHIASNFFEVTCSGEATISFDWVFDAVSRGTDEYWFGNAQHKFTIDGKEVPSLKSDYGYQSASASYSSNPRTSVKAFLTSGTHVLRWEILSGYSYGADVRCAVDNFQITEKPVANRESLFDWCRLGFDYLVWKPGNLEYLKNQYTQRINANANDYEAYIWRALTKIALLGENQKAREVIGRCGYTIADYNFMPSGEFVGLENAPLSNDVTDELTPEILAVLDSALADMKAIPENWEGRIPINPEDFGATVKENEYWDVGNLYYGLAEVSLIRAGIEAMRAAVKLARGYDYEADYIAVSNAAVNARKNGATHIYEFKDVAPKAASIRNYGELVAAKEDFRAALLSIQRADLSIEKRSEYDTAMDRYDEYLVEYDLEAMEEVTEYRKIYNSILASLDATNAVDITWFVNKYDTNDVVRANAPGGLLSRQLFLGALFAGTLTRNLVPDVFLKPVSVDMDTVKDFTLGGLLPDVTFSEVLSRLPFSQTWSVENYKEKGSPDILLGKKDTLRLTGETQESGDISFTAMASGTVTCLVDGTETGRRNVAAGDRCSFAVLTGQTYEIVFAPSGRMRDAAAPFTELSVPKPAFVPPVWNPVTKGDTMVLYAVVKDVASGSYIEEEGSLLAAFDADGECRGVAEVEDGPLGKFFQLSVGIESTSETGLKLKVWNAETSEISDVRTDIDANGEKQLGEFDDPCEFLIGMKTQTITLNEGWSWVSFGLVPETATIGAVLAGGNFADRDMLKASDRVVTYYNGVWYPANYEIVPGAAYMIKKSTGGTERIEIAGMPMTDGISVNAGWNWFGPTTLATQSLASVTHTGGFADKDQVKSATKPATWYGGKWYPADFTLEPGRGYQAKLANAGTLYFGESPKLAKNSMMSMAAPLASASNKPAWKGVTKSDTMVVYAVVSNLATRTLLSAEGTLLAAFDADGECRGVAEVEDGPLGKFFQLSVGIESTSETGFSLKLWDSTSGTVLDIREEFAANTDKQLGEIDAPMTFAAGTDVTECTLTITPADGSVFTEESTEVTITCSPKDAVVYFTTNGANPKSADKYRYSGSFMIKRTTMVKAYAVYGNMKSALVTATITKRDSGLADSLDSDMTFTTGGDADWATDQGDVAKQGGACGRSGVLTDGQESWLETTVSGAGTFTFWWRTDCEYDEWGGATWDHLTVLTNGVEAARIDGTTDWKQMAFTFGKGTHTVRWSYVKDDSDSVSEDCAWLDAVTWIPAAPADPIPDIGENPTQKQVEEALDGSADAKLAVCITNAANYNAYREWAESVKGTNGTETAGALAVKDSPNAWVSFALGSDKLLAEPPTDEDLTVEQFEPSSEAGKFDFTVSVEGVEVGSDAQKENLKQVFGLEGATSLDHDAFSSGNVDLTFGTPENGKVKFTAGPKDGEAKTFFMKVKVNP